MTSPMSPNFSPCLLSNTSTPNDIRDTPLSKKSNNNHTASPFEKNGYLIRSLLPSPYNKSLVSALSSASCSARSILMHSTPQSVKDQYSRHQHLSTPQSQVKNPFEIALINQLSSSLVSPGIFNMATPNSNEENFEWTIDQLATLHPVEIDEKPQYKSTFNPAIETKAQEAIEQYFNTRLVVLSPIENEKSDQNENATSKKSVTIGCQTCLTLPLDFNINKVLGQYMTYEEKRSDAENSQSESFSTASLRRKLFCQEFQESDSSSMGSNMARSDESLNECDIPPAPIPTTPDWDRCASMNPLSSSPVSHRSRRYKSYIAGDALDCSGTVLSPIHQLSSPLSTRSRSNFRRHSLGSLEDSSKRLSSPCVSPINLESHSSEMASLNISDVPMESSMKTPVSSPCHKLSKNNTNCLKPSCLEGMSPLFSSVQKEIELVNSIKIDSDSRRTTLEELKTSKEEPSLQNVVQRHTSPPSSNIYTAKETVGIPSNEAQLFCIKKMPEAQPKCNISMNFSEMTSVLSTSNNFSMMPSKFEVTNVDSLQSVSTSQQDTGYMSYNVGSRSEMSQTSKSGFMGTSSLQDNADTDKYFIDQSSHCKPNHTSLIRSRLHAEKTIADKSNLDYADVVERAHKMLNLTPSIPQSDKQHLETLLKNTASYEASNFQWHPIGASTPTHKNLFKPASETAAEILKKAHDDLSQAL
ncbi:Hypothetical predicted protein [Octopus vulgaris]|uniref:Protein aurora borealis n=1 Tax=Octopus vulgaris TaxID=6645 RepID=A0AA36AQ18_OCTVU|nr:Hypothetical predicted protein [Octopus vulgaris]